jgi:hypothetical protein
MTDANFDEEPWEGQIGAMLGRLPAVDPPPGFMDAAVDRRPLHAGRIMVALAIASIVAVSAAVLTGVTTAEPVAPAVDELARRHNSAVEAGVLGSLGPGTGSVGETPVELPPGFERAGDVAARDLQQAVYARGDEAVSVFVQQGPVAWELMPSEGLTDIDGMRAWVDQSRRIVVVEAGGEIVTVVGLSGDEVADVVAELPRTGLTVGERATRTVRAITGQFGFPD